MIGDVSRARATLTALSLIPVLLVAGCSDDDPEPKFEPPSSEAPSSPGPSSPAPTGPSTATPVSAEGFIDDWFETFSAAMVSGDTTDIRLRSSESCTSCAALADQIDSIYSNGGSLKTAGWSVEEARLLDELAESPRFLLRIKQAERSLLDGTKVVDTTPMAKVPMSVTLSKESGEWQVHRLVILK